MLSVISIRELKGFIHDYEMICVHTIDANQEHDLRNRDLRTTGFLHRSAFEGHAILKNCVTCQSHVYRKQIQLSHMFDNFVTLLFSFQSQTDTSSRSVTYEHTHEHPQERMTAAFARVHSILGRASTPTSKGACSEVVCQLISPFISISAPGHL